MMRNVLKKNKPFIIVLLLLFVVVVIVARSDITFRVMVGFDIKPRSQVIEPKITAGLQPEGDAEIVYQNLVAGH